jgi:hypothetical protein
VRWSHRSSARVLRAVPPWSKVADVSWSNSCLGAGASPMIVRHAQRRYRLSTFAISSLQPKVTCISCGVKNKLFFSHAYQSPAMKNLGGELTLEIFELVLLLLCSQPKPDDGRGKLPGRSLEPADGVGR